MFWTDGLENSTRERNIQYTVPQLKKLSEYLNCSYKIYDYSPVKLIDEAIHIPYPVGVYKRSEKINAILSETNTEMFSIIDADCFVCEEDYSKLLTVLTAAPRKSCITFDVLELSEEDTNSIILHNKQPTACTTGSRFPGRAGMLGALFFTDTDNLRELGGFNTKFTTWGGEDGEIYDKIYRDSTIRKFPLKLDEVRLYHLSHYQDRGNINYFDHDEYVRNNFP